MARMPGTVWKPLPGTSTTRMSAYDIFCMHTMVGSLDGTDAYFRNSASGTNSHFGVGPDGTIYQWVDTAYRSGANYNGNYHIISAETADTGAPFPSWGGSDVPAWTAAQIAALARIAAWCHTTHGIPLTAIPDSMKGRRGIGYHRLGVPGYMVAGSEQWSTHAGKVCPGDRRIAQVPQVIASATTAAPAAPVPEEDDEMKPMLYRLKGTPTVYLAAPGRWQAIDPNFLGTLTVMGQDYKLVDLPTQGHLDFAKSYFEKFLAPDVEGLADVQADMERLLAAVKPANGPAA